MFPTITTTTVRKQSPHHLHSITFCTTAIIPLPSTTSTSTTLPSQPPVTTSIPNCVEVVSSKSHKSPSEAKQYDTEPTEEADS